jgi:hypothetical protein
MPAEPTRGNQDSVHVAHRTVKGELAKECRARWWGLAHHREGDGNGHRQIQAAAFLAQLRRRQIDGQPLAWKLEPAVSNC